MQPDISFIIAAFNAAATIERAIASALSQKDVVVEVVVVDDSSSDATASIIKGFGDPRVQLVRHEANMGPGAARNSALKLACGRFVSVLDADDTVLEDRMVRLLAQFDVTDADVLLDGIEVVHENGSRKRMFSAEALAGLQSIDLPFYLRNNVVLHSKFNLGYLKPTIRRAFLEEHSVRYPEDIRIGEDCLFIAEILAKGGVCRIVPEVGYSYGINKGSVSRVLRRHHVEHMREADETFESRHELSTDTRAALQYRRRAFGDASAFITMVDAVKERDVAAFYMTALRHPAALRHFRMPVAKRVADLLSLFRGKAA